MRSAESLEAIWNEAVEFNRSLKIPVRWKRAHRIGSLRRKAWADGYRSNSVEHVLLLDDLSDGRLKRKRGDFLCSARITNLSAHQIINMSDSDEQRSKRQKVTCPKCIEIAQRWTNEKSR
jgi:hypothetical protein